MSAFSPQQSSQSQSQHYQSSNGSNHHYYQQPVAPPSPQEMPYSSFSPSKYSQQHPQFVSGRGMTGMESLLNAIEYSPIQLPPLSYPPPSPPHGGSPSASPQHHQQSYERKNSGSFPLPMPTSSSAMSISSLLDTPAPAPISPKEQPLSLTDADYSIASILVSSTPSYTSSATRSTAFTPYIANSNNSTYKRKWSDSSYGSYDEERATKIRRSIREQLGGHRAPNSPMMNNLPSPQRSPRSSPPPISQMTTITCYHAAVAQKSYGSEKRFLCPPPVVVMSGPLPSSDRFSSERPQIAMSVVCETGDRPIEHKAPLDDNMKGSFKYLHVTGTAKAKQFHLKLKMLGGKQNTPIAVFDSSPISIISKPSKKTAKARNVSSCILSCSPVSLFNRINSQTVRTKYMGIDSGQLCAKNSSWSSFTISVVNRSPASTSPYNSPVSSPPWKNGSASSPAPTSSSASTPITYGTEIILTDTETGVSSDVLIIRKVEKGRIAQGACGPVSQMQKVALQRVARNVTGSNRTYYLSAAGASPSPDANDRNGTDPLNQNNPNATNNTFLGYQRSRVVHVQSKSSNSSSSGSGSGCDSDDAIIGDTVEEVDDYLCWTIVGISKFEYTFFETSSGSGSGSPSAYQPLTNYPITPFPTLTTTPTYRLSNHTLELIVTNFFSETQQPMEVWLGHHGPLKNTIIRRSAPIAPSSSLPGTTMQLKSAGSYANSEATTVLVELPSTQDVVSCNHDLLVPSGVHGRALELPILFVRQDGVVYHSSKACNVYVDSHGENGKWSVKNAA